MLKATRMIILTSQYDHVDAPDEAPRPADK